MPVLGTRELASESPLPYGLGLYQRSEAGVEVGQDMYYVSPEVAKARGRGVLPGWYVVATPGTEFTLRLTNVHEVGNGMVRDKIIDLTFAACAEVIVDGLNVIGGISAYQVNPAGEETRISGFQECETFRPGYRRGESDVRVFRFSKVHPRADVQGEEDECVGSLRLRIHSGRLRVNTNSHRFKINPTAPEVGEVNETSASKLGRSVRVDKNGAIVNERILRSAYSVERENMEGEVMVFMRERYWLESRSIIDADGNAFKPKRVLEVIDVDGYEDDTNNSDDDDIEVVYLKRVTAVKEEDEEEYPPGHGATKNSMNAGDGKLTQVGNVAVNNIPDNSTANGTVTPQNAKRNSVSMGKNENVVEADPNNNRPPKDNPANPTLTVNAQKTIGFAVDPKGSKPGLQKNAVADKPDNSKQNGAKKRANTGAYEVNVATIGFTVVKMEEGNEAQSDDEDNSIEITGVSEGEEDDENEGSAKDVGKKRKKTEEVSDEIKTEDEVVQMRAKKRVCTEAEQGSPENEATVAEVNRSLAKDTIDST